MPYIDPAAAAHVRRLRESRGFSPEMLAHEIKERAEHEKWRIGACDAFTIRRIEGNTEWHGRVPGLRVRVVLETYFGTPIFQPENRVWVENSRKQLVAA